MCIAWSVEFTGHDCSYRAWNYLYLEQDEGWQAESEDRRSDRRTGCRGRTDIDREASVEERTTDQYV